MMDENPYVAPKTQLSSTDYRSAARNGRVHLNLVFLIYLAVNGFLALRHISAGEGAKLTKVIVRFGIFVILWTLTYKGYTWSRKLLGAFGLFGFPLAILILFNDVVKGIIAVAFMGYPIWVFLISKDVRALGLERKVSQDNEESNNAVPLGANRRW